MALDIFKKSSKKKGTTKASSKSGVKVARKAKKVVDASSTDTVKVDDVANKQNTKNLFASKYLSGPHISEKASMFLEQKGEDMGPKYIFRVMKIANKLVLKKTIEDRYDVKVASVRIINTPDKKVRRGRIIGHRPGYKKAIVTLRPGNSIDKL